MRVGFYLSAQEPVERVLPQIARKALAAGERMVIVSADEEQLGRLDRALWELYPEDFLAHGRAGEAHADRQPLLLATSCSAENGARLVALADGAWREDAAHFDRAFLFFDDGGRADARRTWSELDGRSGVEREFHEHRDGRWQQKR